jgi:hypothetical protein
VISASDSKTAGTPVLGSTITVQAEAAAGNGGRTFREFEVGYGLTGELMAGYYEHVVIRSVTPIPSGMSLFFVWSLEVFSSAKLWKFVDYPAGGTSINIPEGADQITFQDAGVVTFLIPQFGTTFTRAVIAGEILPIVWSAMSFSAPTKLLFRLKSI